MRLHWGLVFVDDQIHAIKCKGLGTRAKEGLLACADLLRGQGFFVTDKEIDRPLYEFEAIKENQKWKIKMSGDCEIILQKLD